ncbi:MAG: peptidylprolyl isomerase [Elusimicrobiota bacterium]|jgi:peptidyl-prolyl cis-trans isomerase B (cyclophilin B)
MKQALIETNRGTIKAKLFDKECPSVTGNFEKLANSKFYDGQKWHRVIKNFMIQGGDPLSREGGPRVGTGGPGYKIDCEIRPQLKHAKGALSMAHAGTCEHDPSGEKLSGDCSNGSQFFITHLPTPHLDGVHTVFGQVTEGLDVVDAIRQNDDIVSIRVQ